LKKIIAGLVLLLILVVAAGIFTHYFFLRPPALKRIKPAKEYPLSSQVEHKAPPFEVFPEERLPRRKTSIDKKNIPLKKPLPRVAIIIDDLGYQKKLAEKFIHLDAVLTVSILPYSPYHQQLAKLARSRGYEVMLHLPMEPLENHLTDSGEGTLLTTMTPDELIQQLNNDLEAVPYISGVNNHMGSKMTANSEQMHQIFTVIKKRGLYYIDSRTTAETVGRPSARLFQVPFAERDIFIDHVQEADFIRKQIELLVDIAHEKGQAVGIAHPYPLTYDIFLEELPKIKKEVQLVSASDVVTIDQ